MWSLGDTSKGPLVEDDEKDFTGARARFTLD